MSESAPKNSDNALLGGEELPGSGDKSGGEPAKSQDPPRRRGRPRSATNSKRAKSGGEPTAGSQEHEDSADQRIVRKKWPKSRPARLKAMAKAMPDFIRQYSNEAAIAQAMNVSRSDVSEVIAKSDELREAMAVAEADREALLLDVVFQSAVSNGKGTDARWLLERLYSETYARKTASSTAKQKKSFTAPSESEAPKSVLGGN